MARLGGVFFCLVLPGAIVLLPARRAAAKFDAAINLKTAETLSLTIPLSVLARADEAASQRRHGSNPCFVMVAFSPLFPPLPCRASREGEPIVVIPPTSTPGATARCRSRPQSARRTSLLIEDGSWRSQAPSRGLSQKRPGAVPRQTNNERPLGVPAGV